MRFLVGLIAVLATSACVLTPDGEPPPQSLPGIELITWETTSLGPFCKGCRYLTIAVASDGRLWVERSRWSRNGKTWLVSHPQVTATQEQLDQFRDLLASVRPVGKMELIGPEQCENYWYDLAEITVKWINDLRTDELRYDFGCSRREIATALRAIPDIFGLEYGAP